MPEDLTSMSWWGDGALPDGAERYWRMGPLDVWVRRSDGEWSTLTRAQGDPLERTLVVASEQGPEPPSDSEWTRTVGPLGDAFCWIPTLADRPVVVRSEAPLRILPGASASFFVSTPLWARLEAGSPPGVVFEGPIARPSDTWFGPSTREGELCYASRTTARRSIDDLPVWPTRAVTVMQVNNEGADSLSLERVKVPVPLLSLFATPDGRVWSNAVVVTREASGASVNAVVVAGPPSCSPDAAPLADARTSGPGVLRRALDGLIR